MTAKDNRVELNEAERDLNDTVSDVNKPVENILEDKDNSKLASNISSEVNIQEPEPDSDVTSNPKNMSAGAIKLRDWLNKLLRIEMTDGRSLVGIFLCTDRDANIILGSCSEYLPEDEECDSDEHGEEPRMLGLVMVPGKHIVSISIDTNKRLCDDDLMPLSENIISDDVI